MQDLIMETSVLEITNIKKKTKEVAYKSFNCFDFKEVE